ncbi:hypothetical protein [Acidocella sp. C78]|uniref:hypothetical protein n=1 Tax=Acidocella sp. C78 TaxID=1671486 RepID=UPI00191B99E2|nr:hypothetical protein [Acidocella sp. C78]
MNEVESNIPFEFISVRPSTHEIIRNRVRQLIERGQLNAAALLLPSLRRLGEDFGMIAVLEAMIQFSLGDRGRAKQIVADALIEHPGHPLLLRMTAEISLDEHDWIEAAKASAEAITFNPRDATSKSMLGRALLELGQEDEGVVCLREALVDMPDNLQILRALARSAPGEAEIATKAALDRFGSRADGDQTQKLELTHVLISSLLARGAFEEASSLISDLIIDGIANLDTCLLAVQVATNTGNWEEATTLFNAATRSLPRTV